MTEQEIKVKVMEKYPVTERERRGCEQEKQANKALRELYTKRLISEKDKKIIQ